MIESFIVVLKFNFQGLLPLASDKIYIYRSLAKRNEVLNIAKFILSYYLNFSTHSFFACVLITNN